MRDLVWRFRAQFFYAGLFSLGANLLLIAPAIYMLQVFDRVITSRSMETLVLLSLITVGALVVMFLLEVLRGRLLAMVGVALEAISGPSILARLLDQAARLTGADQAAGLRDIGLLRAALAGPGILALFDAPWLVFYVGLIFLFHPVLGWLAFASALALLVIAVLNERLTRRSIEAGQREAAEAARFAGASLRNAEVVAGMGMSKAVAAAWSHRNEAALDCQAEANRRGGVLAGMSRAMRQLVQVVMLGAGAYLVVEQHATPGITIAATIILGRALAPVEMLIGGWKSLYEAWGAYQRLERLFASQAAAVAPTELPAPAGRLAFERVIFSFKAGDRPILRGVSFELPPGETLGVIGPTGSGKSTLVRLALGIWRPNSGSVRLDGAEVWQRDRDALGRYVGYLPQDVELFPGTVAQNIARMNEPDSEKVVAAAERAHVNELVLRLPQGYDTRLGPGQHMLSGGEQQCIGLARALYDEPRFVVLDEPNANLDTDGEEALLAALKGLREARITVIVVCHRPILLEEADRILVLKGGEVALYGPRAEVMARVAAARRGPAGPQPLARPAAGGQP